MVFSRVPWETWLSFPKMLPRLLSYDVHISGECFFNLAILANIAAFFFLLKDGQTFIGIKGYWSGILCQVYQSHCTVVRGVMYNDKIISFKQFSSLIFVSFHNVKSCKLPYFLHFCYKKSFIENIRQNTRMKYSVLSFT